MKHTVEPSEISIEISGIVAEVLLQHGYSRASAERISRQTFTALLDAVGSGSIMYCRKHDDLELEDAEMKISNEFDGTNVVDLASLHGLSNRQIYKMLIKSSAAKGAGKRIARG